jgi:HKD family nuclease
MLANCQTGLELENQQSQPQEGTATVILPARKREPRASSLSPRMAELEFILQAVTTANHAEALRALLALPNPTEVLVSVAFVREPGLDAVEAAIKPIAARARFFVGIRNDITSIQAVKRLLAMKVKLYAVDTGSRSILFHPKLYLAASASKATVIIGSANLTFGGLHNNIEVSTRVNLNLSNAADKVFCDKVTEAFAEMLKGHPQHVFLIRDNRHAEELFESGRLSDENLISAPSTTSSVKKGERDDLPRMKLTHAARRHIKASVIKAAQATKPKKPAKAAPAAGLPSASAVRYLVWESKPLMERDLNIPTGTNTAATGSMGLKKGALDDDSIDHRHYFRDEVFADLAWTIDPSPAKAYIERAHANFELVVKNLNYGVFNLLLSNNTNLNSRSYLQGNFMTQIHWGEAKRYIAKADLLGRILYLYRKDTTPPEFTIEID